MSGNPRNVQPKKNKIVFEKVLSRPDFIKCLSESNMSFVRPEKKVKTAEDVKMWEKSEAYSVI